MRFNCRIGYILIAVAVSLCCSLRGQHSEIFKRYDTSILQEKVREADGVVFGVARETSPDDDEMVVQLTGEGCELSATARLLEVATLSGVKWPKEISYTHCRLLQNAITRQLSVSGKLRGCSIVHKVYDSETNQWVCVAAVDKSQLASVPRLTLSDVRCQLLTPSEILFSDTSVHALKALKDGKSTPPSVFYPEWNEFISGPLSSKMAYAIRRILGSYPLCACISPKDRAYKAGIHDFFNGKLHSAYDNFLLSLESDISYDALNMIGNVGRRIGKERDAVVFLLHAVYVNPNAPYPWVHLAHIARMLGNETLKEACCQKAEKLATDRWSKSQLELLRKQLPPFEPTPALTAEPQAAVSKKKSAPARKSAAISPEPKPADDGPSVKPVAKPAEKPVVRPAVRQTPQTKATPVMTHGIQPAAKSPAKAVPAREPEATPLGLPVGLDFPGGLPIPEADRAKARELGVNMDAVLKLL